MPPKIYDKLIRLSGIQENDLSNKLLERKINKKPLKSKFEVFENCFIWQCDLQHLRPNRSVYKYLLVCVDASTRKVDAEPMRDRTAYDTNVALRNILNRHLICPEFPKIIVTDDGAEFQNEFTRYCNQHGIKHRRTQAGRKQQTSIVEHMNDWISFALNSFAYHQMTTPKNEPPKTLLQINILADNILPRTIQAINEFVATKYPKPAEEWFDFDFDQEAPDIKIGDKVYVINPQLNRYRTRNGTHRYMTQQFEVTEVYRPILKGQPFRFKTTFSNRMTFLRDEMIKARDFRNNAHVVQFD